MIRVLKNLLKRLFKTIGFNILKATKSHNRVLKISATASNCATRISNDKKNIAITYVIPAIEHPIGGIKVAYRHSEMLSNEGVESYIFHPEDSTFSCAWFTHNAKLREAKRFDIQRDFLVIPEVWAANFGKQCLRQNIKYAIFVQNGYLIGAGKGQSTEAELKKVYESADLIISISEDTSEIITLAYPQISRNKIIRLLPSVGKKFISRVKKKRVTFMPRKLPNHADLVRFYMNEHLPKDWTFVPIVNKNEDEVAGLLSESSIFASFSDMEGCPLPPLEAAFAGNAVVGYTGQGAKEYFSQPIFTEIENGDFRKFIQSILELTKKIDDGLFSSSIYLQQLEEIKLKYSAENELIHLMTFAKRVEEMFTRNAGITAFSDSRLSRM